MKNRQPRRAALYAALVVALAGGVPPAAGQTGSPPAAGAATPAAAPEAARPAGPAAARATARRSSASAGGSTTPSQLAGRPCTAVTVDPPLQLTLGKSRVVRLTSPAARLVVGGQSRSRAGVPVQVEPEAPVAAPGGAAAARASAQHDGVADTEITLLSPTELFLLGRRPGSMNLVVQGSDGRCVVKDIVVTIDPGTLQAQLQDVMPEENSVRVRGAENSLVLTGTVSDAMKLDQILTIANSYADPKKVVNLLRVNAPQQVMLEVKIAEVSKTLLDRLGLNFARAFTSGNVTTLISGIIGGGNSLLSRVHGGPGLPGGVTSSTQLGIDANKKDGIVRVLAEPSIVAISGQSASFLSGGKIFIPVAQTHNGSIPTITLEEKEFGVGLKFTPTVLGDRVNLKIVSEVSELSQTGTPFTAIGGEVAILPSMTTRRVDTTVQLGDGQSFAVAGLIKNNMTEALNKLPGLGEAPVLGALFRSSEFQNDQTELMFVVTPHLVKAMAGPVALPTDTHIPPNRADVMLMGVGEGKGTPTAPAVVAPTPAPPMPQPAPAPAPVTAPAPRPTSQAEPAPVRTSQLESTPIPVSQAVAEPAADVAATTP